jgi:hypothetical protein
MGAAGNGVEEMARVNGVGVKIEGRAANLASGRKTFMFGCVIGDSEVVD